MLNIISCEFLEEIIYNLFLNEGREIYNEKSKWYKRISFKSILKLCKES